MERFNIFDDDMLHIILDNSNSMQPKKDYTAQQKMVLESYGKVNFDGEEIDAVSVLAILQYLTETNQRAIEMLADDKSECRYLDENIVTEFWLSNQELAKEIEYRKKALLYQMA